MDTAEVSGCVGIGFAAGFFVALGVSMAFPRPAHDPMLTVATYPAEALPDGVGREMPLSKVLANVEAGVPVTVLGYAEVE